MGSMDRATKSGQSCRNCHSSERVIRLQWEDDVGGPAVFYDDYICLGCGLYTSGGGSLREKSLQEHRRDYGHIINQTKQGHTMSDQVDQWDLFHSQFRDGEDVVIILDDDTARQGKLTAIEQGALIQPSSAKVPTLYHWDRIQFISHDGFPVRKLLGADGSKTIAKLDTTNTEVAIREALLDGPLKKVRAVIHDPWFFEDCSFQLVNAGRREWIHTQRGIGETLLLQSKDGAQAQLYDLAGIYWLQIGPTVIGH